MRSLPIPGRPANLSARQKAKLEVWLLRGPLATGDKTDRRTLNRIAHLIRYRCGVTDRPSHVRRVPQAVGLPAETERQIRLAVDAHGLRSAGRDLPTLV